MIAWKSSPANYKPAVERFLKTGAAAPEGLKTIGRWHAPGSGRGFHLVEGSDAALVEINAEWADLLELDVVRSLKTMWPARSRRSSLERSRTDAAFRSPRGSTPSQPNSGLEETAK